MCCKYVFQIHVVDILRSTGCSIFQTLRRYSAAVTRPSVKVKERKRIYIAPLLKYLTLKALRYGSHSVTCKLHRTCLQ